MIRVHLYQPIYDSVTLSDLAFLPFHLGNNEHRAWRELWIILELYRQGLHKKADFVGLLSPKFVAKTGLSSTDVIAHVEANATADVCLFCPAPYLPYMAYNAWEHGDLHHPGLLQEAQAWLDACDVQWDLSREGRYGPDISCYSNFWVARPEFWERYVGGLLTRLVDYLETNVGSDVYAGLLSEAKYHEPAPFLPFIAERLFPTFLAHNRDIKAAALRLDPIGTAQYEFRRDIVSTLRPTVDAADQAAEFPVPVREQLRLLSRLVRKYEELYYLHNPRPWTSSEPT